MLAILNPNESLTVVMSGAAATTNPTYAATWHENGSPDSNHPVGSLNGATAVTPVGAPLRIQRIVDALDIYNGDTAAVTVTVSKVVGSTSYTLFSRSIAVGATLHVDSRGPSVLATDAPAGVGAAAGTGVVASEQGNGIVQRTLLTLTDLLITVTDALAYASQKVYDFPEGRILILGATGNLQFGVTTDRTATTGTINDNASLTWSLGTVAASNISLTGTMVNLLPLATKVLAAATTAYNTTQGNPLAASAQFDGTGTPVDALLNVAFATNTDIDNDGILKVSGTITLSWMNLGDY